MKFVAIINYAPDKAAIKAVGTAHHDYFRGLLDSGHLFAAGPLVDGAGALWIYEAETSEEADKRVRDDPYNAAGVFLKWQIHPLAYWSSKTHKGA